MDKTIDDLLAAEAVTADDLFVVQQNATAKKVSGDTLRRYVGQEADLPKPDSADEGAFLRVRNKKWVAEAVPAAEERKEWKKIIDAEIAESTMVFEATGLDNVTELYCEWGGLKSASATNGRDLDLYINDIAVGVGWVRNATSNGQDIYGYSISTYNGFVWYNTRSAGIVGASNANKTDMGNNAKISYRLAHGVGAATKIKIKAPNADNAPVVGKLEVWAR